MEELFQNIKTYLDIAGESYEVPDYIKSNLKHDFWYWQKNAMQYFDVFEKRKDKFVENINEPTHLMFNMATGTGKTMIMAALILYYYKKGYRHFIFFVNQKNIVDKTENNFINKLHSKYEYRQNIVIEDKTINISKVETFDETDEIQIKFTSIHKLHNAVYLAKENSVTLDELQRRDLVMIGDEAHHLNASTIRNGQMEMDLPLELKENASEKDVERSWENTVLNKILRKGKIIQDSENKNVLLEFTATVPKNADVKEKYKTKTIYKFELVDFLKAGYTKEINLVSTSLNKKEKILLALLFNWYRHQVALKNNIPNFKPVILFRSKLIDESKNDFKYFKEIIRELKPIDYKFLKEIESKIEVDKESLFKVYEQGKSRINQMLGFIKAEKVNIQDIVEYIQGEFSERNCIITNSEDNKATTKENTTEEQDQLLNSLEDKNNHIRAIFTVKRLTEGWDVLNLFDIVRLYTGRDGSHKGKQRVAGEATVQEIQLIGRGVRYYPFNYNTCEKNKRKFDNDLENPIRVLEEFYYHSDDDVKYLNELKDELKKKGYIQDKRMKKSFGLKENFKEREFFKEIKIWKNEWKDNPNRRKLTLKELSQEFVFDFKTSEFVIREQQIALDKDVDDIVAESTIENKMTIAVTFAEFLTDDKHIVRKAINLKAKKDLSLLRFDYLQRELKIDSIDDIFKSEFIGDFRINIITSAGKNNLSDISNGEKLRLLIMFFEEFTKKLKEFANPYIGDDFKPFSFKELFGEEKQKNVLINAESEQFEKELLNHDWYVLNGFNGTSEEIELLKFIQDRIENLNKKYKEVYLLRNEEVYTIYDFSKGRGFEPDFLLFLKGKDNKNNIYYQIFIETKGEHLIEHDDWKEKFLLELSEKFGNKELLKAENKKYKIFGLPFFNSQDKTKFVKEFEKFTPDD